MSWEPRVLWAALDFDPHPTQQAVLHQVAMALRPGSGSPRFLDVTTGRQWGKTLAAETALWMAMVEPPDALGRPPNVRVIADKYEHGRLIWDKFVAHAQSSPLLRPLVADFSKDRELLTLKTGATAQLLSADSPQSLTGFTLSLALVDEAAFVLDTAYEHLMPCLAVRQGVLLAFGTAEGQGWHRTLFLRGQDPNYPDHWSVTYESTDNPYFPQDELEVQKLLLPRRRYEQLYLARWQSEEGAVFHNVEGCTDDRAPLEVTPDPNREYVIGCDFGRHSDFTVAYVGDARTGRVLYQLRETMSDWMSQVERVAALSKTYNNAVVVADATGVGDAVVSILRDRGVSVIPVVFSPQTKDRLVHRLVLALEREEIRFPRYDALLRELSVYETRTLPSGRIQTGAPVGYHDDCVSALSLLNEGFNQGYGGQVRQAVEDLWTQ